MKNNAYERKGFFLFTDMAKCYDGLTSERFGNVIRAALVYCDTGVVPEIKDAEEKIAFSSMKLWVDLDRERYNNIIEKRRESGKKGADARWHKEENLERGTEYA